MPLTCIGPHDIQGWPLGVAWAAGASIAKSVGNVAAISAVSTGGVTIFRWQFSEVEQSDLLDHAAINPKGAAQRLVGTILAVLGGYRRAGLHVELLNEIGKSRRAAYVALCKEAIPLLKAAGLKVCGPSWATGDFEQEDWDAFVNLGWDAIALHAYWSSNGFSKWNALRWQQYWKPGQPLVLITECGRDRVRDGTLSVNDGYIPVSGTNFGFKAQGITDEDFLKELEAYDLKLKADPAVMGATGFTTSPTDDWKAKGFDLDSLAKAALAKSVITVLRGQSKPNGGVPVAGQDKWTVGPGMAQKMKEQADKPISNEHYLGDFMSVAFGNKGIYIYSKEANRTFFLPAR